MRILFVSHSFPPRDRPLDSVGGMQRVAKELLAALPAHAAVSRLVLRSTWRWHHIRCALWLMPALYRIWRKARRREMDAVLFSSMVTGSLGLLLRRTLSRRGIVAAATAHGKDVTQKGPYQWFLVRRILRALDAVLPVSRATAAACIARGMPEKAVFVIPNGVNPYRFALAGSPTGSPFLLCSVGRLVQRKGVAWFVRSVMPLLPASVHYHIGGVGPDHGNIAAAIHRHGLADRVRLLGRLSEPDLVHLYGRAGLLVMPNIQVPGDMEGFGIVMLEAGACGVGSVAARLEGIQDVITDGINGHLADSGDAAAFARIIMHYVHHPEALKQLGLRAREHTLAHFRWDAIAARYVHVLEELRRQGSDRGVAPAPPRPASSA